MHIKRPILNMIYLVGELKIIHFSYLETFAGYDNTPS